MCGNHNRERRDQGSIVKEGWTEFFVSTDTPKSPVNSKNPGEHEHYFYYAGNSKRKQTEVYDSNGKRYTDCHKKAIIVRERNTHKYWWDLRMKYTLQMVFNSF